MNAVQCIVFDVDGTLADTNRLIFASFNHVARLYAGKEFTIPEITAMFGPPEEGALLHIVPPEQLDAAMNDYLQFYRAEHDRLVSPFGGMKDVLQTVQDAGLHCAVFTGKGMRAAKITLEECGIERYFQYIVSGNDVQRYKPDPEGLYNILEHFHVRPEETVMVGDSNGDIQSALTAGVFAVAVRWDPVSNKRPLHVKPDLEFQTVAEFHRWLKRTSCGKKEA
jgi:HAD superfamily hydrolase (TIGR01509 family)